MARSCVTADFTVARRKLKAGSTLLGKRLLNQQSSDLCVSAFYQSTTFLPQHVLFAGSKDM